MDDETDDGTAVTSGASDGSPVERHLVRSRTAETSAPDLRPPVEMEIKLFVPPSAVAAVWRQPLVIDQAFGPRRVERLTNRYFDTPGRDLARQRMALRLRGDGSGWKQTLKTRGGGAALTTRGEWEFAVDGAAIDWKQLRGTPLAEFAGRRASRSRMRVVFTTDFERESQCLRLRDGSEVEFAFDRGTIVAEPIGDARASKSETAGGPRLATICEVEIELKRAGRDDPATALLRFAEHLSRSLPLLPLGASKAERGYALADDHATGTIRMTFPRAACEIGARRHLARMLATCNESLAANAYLLSTLTSSPTDDEAVIEPVHQARVAIRRMRSALRLFRPAVDGRRLRAVDRDLRGLGRVFGAMRDHDVFMTSTMKRLEDRVGTDDEGRDALARIRGEVEARRSESRRALMRTVDGGAFGTTTLGIDRLVARLDRKGDPGAPLGGCAGDWLADQHARVVSRARRIATLDQEARHRLRIEVKRLRYAIDLLAGLYEDGTVADYRATLSDLQGRLGKLNDEAVAQTLLGAMSAGSARDLVLARASERFDHRLRKQLPKVAAGTCRLELAARPWTRKRSPVAQ